MDLLPENFVLAEKSCLFIRLDTSVSAPVYWWLEGESQASGELADVSMLSQLAALTEKVRTCVIVPAANFIFRRIPFSARLNRQSKKALVWNLEPFALTDVEQLHSLVLAHDEQEVLLGAVEKRLMHFWKQTLEEAGIRAMELYPDALLLPENTPVSWHSGWLIRANGQGYALPDEWHGEAAGTMSASLRQGEPGPVEQIASLWMQTLSEGTPVSWLQREYRPRRSQRAGSWTVPTRWITACAALILLLAGLQSALQSWQWQTQAERQARQNAALYLKMFAARKAPVNIQREAKNQLHWLQLQQDTRSFLPLIQTLIPAFQGAPDLQLVGVNYQRGELKMTLMLRSQKGALDKPFLAALAQDSAVLSSKCKPSPVSTGTLCTVELDLS